MSGPGRSQRGAHLVEQLALAAETMSRQRIGALVLVERDADLSELATQGAAIEVDAELSANLLVQVFTPPGPLHDGAVIIQGDRVGVAAAILPLSQNPQIDTRLGTRHRAALRRDRRIRCNRIGRERGDGGYLIGRSRRIDPWPERYDASLYPGPIPSATDARITL